MTVLGDVELSESGALVSSFLGFIHSHCSVLVAWRSGRQYWETIGPQAVFVLLLVTRKEIR